MWTFQPEAVSEFVFNVKIAKAIPYMLSSNINGVVAILKFEPLFDLVT